MIKGIKIQLIKQTKTGEDDFGAEIFEDETIEVDNVLVGEPTSDDITNSINLYGKRISYVLAIPKGDTNVWTDTKVILPEPFKGIYSTVGEPTAGIEENIPLQWNKKVRVERIG